MSFKWRLLKIIYGKIKTPYVRKSLTKHMHGIFGNRAPTGLAGAIIALWLDWHCGLFHLWYKIPPLPPRDTPSRHGQCETLRSSSRGLPWSLVLVQACPTAQILWSPRHRSGLGRFWG